MVGMPLEVGLPIVDDLCSSLLIQKNRKPKEFYTPSGIVCHNQGHERSKGDNHLPSHCCLTCSGDRWLQEM